MTYKLFIDDLRDPITNDWKIARSSTEAKNIVTKFGIPNEIAFDHDLGSEDNPNDTSIIFIKWLIEQLLDKELFLPVGFKFSVHSMNPIGAVNIKCLMKGVMEEFKPMTTAIQYHGFHALHKSHLKVFSYAKDALFKAGINISAIPEDDLKIGLQWLGAQLDYLIFAMVVKYNNKYYCFNYYPQRKEVTLTYTLNECDVKKQINETLASLRRLHDVKNVA